MEPIQEKESLNEELVRQSSRPDEDRRAESGPSKEPAEAKLADLNPPAGSERRRPKAPEQGSGDGAEPIGTAADPEVADRPIRRQFTAKYKLRILREAESCSRPGELGALVRREGLYLSYLGMWRRQRDKGILEGVGSKKRGKKAKPNQELLEENKRLRRQNERLKKRLGDAETIIEVQKKVSSLLGIPLKDQDNDENA